MSEYMLLMNVTTTLLLIFSVVIIALGVLYLVTGMFSDRPKIKKIDRWLGKHFDKVFGIPIKILCCIVVILVLMKLILRIEWS